MAGNDTRRLRVVIDGDSRGGQRAFTDVTDAADRTEKRVGRFSSRFATAVSSMAGVAKLAAGVTAGLFGLSVLKKGIDRLSTIEDATASLTIALGSASKAGKLMDKVLTVVKGTPFNLDQFATAAKNLVVFGVAADKVPKYLHAMGEAAAASGAGAESVQVLVNAFGDAATIGHITGDTLFTLASQGVPALKILANAYGVTTEVMQKMVSKGMVPATKGMDILTKGIEKGSHGIAGTTVALGGSMESLRKTFHGSFGGMEAALARFGAAIIGPFMGNITSGMTGITKLLDTTGAKVKEFLTAFASGLKGLGAGNAGFSGWANSLGLAFRALATGEDIAVEATTPMVKAATLLRESIVGMIDAFKDGNTTSDGFRGMLELTAIAFHDLLNATVQLVKVAIDIVQWFRDNTLAAKILTGAIAGLIVLVKAHALAMAIQNGALMTTWKSTLLYTTGAKIAAAAQWAWNGAVVGAKWLSAAVLLDGYLVKQKLVAVWSKIAAGAQWLWNIAMTANPIALVVIAIAAFVAAIILLWKHSDGFRKFVLTVLWPAVKKVWEGMKAIAMVVANAMVAAWNWIKDTAISVWNAIVGFLKPIASTIYNVLKPIINVITTIGNIIWIVYKNAWKVVWILIQIAVKLVVIYFQNVVVPAWKVGFAIIQIALGYLKAVFESVWKGVMKVIHAAVGWFQSTVVPMWDKAFARIRIILQILAQYFSWAWRKISDAVQIAFNAIAGPISRSFKAGIDRISGWLNTFRGWWDSLFEKLRTKVVSFKDGVVKTFNQLKDGIKKAWDLLVGITKAPINFLIGTVYSDHIVPMWNRVAEKFGIKTRLETIPRLATGGMVPGAGNRDTVPALLTPGEGVLTKREMKLLGGPKGFADLRNQIGAYAQYSQGGVVQKFADGGVVGWFKGLASKGKDIFQGLAAGAISPLVKLIRNVVDSGLPKGGFSGLLRAGGNTMLDKFMSWIRGKDKEIPDVGSLGAGAGEGFGWKWMRSVISRRFPGLGMISGFRPGARTLSGRQSYHALGRAVDYPPNKALAMWIRGTFGKNTKELITPWNELNLLNGRPHRYTGAVWNQHNFRGGNAHDHWAMDGVTKVEPGPFTGVNRTGRTETLVNADLIGDGGIHFHGPVNFNGVQNVKQLRDEVLKLANRNGGRSGIKQSS